MGTRRAALHLDPFKQTGRKRVFQHHARSYGDCIRTLGPREGACKHKLRGRERGPEVDRGPGEAVRGSGGPAETLGDTRRPPSALSGAKTQSAGGSPRPASSAVQGRGREVARAEDGDEAQPPPVAHRTLLDVHAGQPPHLSGHGPRAPRASPAAAKRGGSDTGRAWRCGSGWRGTQSGESAQSRPGGRGGETAGGTPRLGG